MSRDWQKDMDMIQAYIENRHLSDYPEQRLAGEPVANVIHYWLQQSAAEKERADQAELLIDNLGGGDRYKYIRHVRKELNDEITLLVEHIIKVEEREQKLKEARPIDEWDEDYGDVLWWKFPICEPPYCGTPLDSDWPDYHTHWTPIVVPDKEEETK